jgi:hypothetical protein
MIRIPKPRGDRTAKARVASLEARRKQANERAADVAPIITALQTAGATSLNGVARGLNMRGVPTVSRKGQWDESQVRRVLARLQVGAVAARSAR